MLSCLVHICVHLHQNFCIYLHYCMFLFSLSLSPSPSLSLPLTVSLSLSLVSFSMTISAFVSLCSYLSLSLSLHLFCLRVPVSSPYPPPPLSVTAEWQQSMLIKSRVPEAPDYLGSNPSVPLISCVAWDKPFNLSMPQLAHQ